MNIRIVNLRIRLAMVALVAGTAFAVSLGSPAVAEVPPRPDETEPRARDEPDAPSMAHVTVALDLVGSQRSDGPLRIRAMDAASDLEVDAVADVDGTAQLPLARGTWLIEIVTRGYWSPTASVLSDGTSRGRLRLPVYPTNTIRGRLVFGKDAPDASSLVMSFAPIRTASATERRIEGKVPCRLGTVEDANHVPFECPVPLGVHDLRLRAPGFVSVFKWSTAVGPDRETNLGDLAMHPGASVTGWLESDAGQPVRGATVTLRQAVRRDPTPDTILDRTTTSDERGFFHLEGVPPDAYWLEASKDGLLPAVIADLNVREGNEAEIETPLVLSSPVEYTLRVEPPSDPEGGRWQLRLASTDDFGETISGTMDALGEWRTSKPVPGRRYHLVVMTSKGARYATRPLDLDRDQTDHVIALALASLRGRVLLGDQPLSAKVYIGSMQGAASVMLESDDRGAFEGTVRRRDTWDVDVLAESPSVFRRFRDVTAREDASGVLVLELRLPDTEIRGTVVDSAGVPVGNATVTIIKLPFDEWPSSTSTDSKGAFSLYGLAFGDYRLQAAAPTPDHPPESAPVDVAIENRAPVQDIRLVLVNPGILAGRIVFQGQGVPGAEIQVRKLDVPMSSVSRTASGRGGAFELAVPDHAQWAIVDVRASGLVYRRQHVQLPVESPVSIAVERSGGGTVAITFEEPLVDATRSGRWPYLYGDSPIPFSLADLTRWSLANGQPPFDGRELVVPLLPAGPYEICWAGRVACRGGFLNPGSQLMLRLPKYQKHEQ